MMSQGEQTKSRAWALVCYLGNGESGRLAVIRERDGQFSCKAIAEGRASAEADGHRPVFIGLAGDDGVLLMDPVSKAIRCEQAFPVDAVAAYAYDAPDGRHVWFMNDGDKETGVDELNCGTRGSSVTIVRRTDNGGIPAEHVTTLCVGRGHHVTTFSESSGPAPRVPQRAYVSNLLDGTISVVGNDPGDGGSYLKVIDTINLCDPQREKGGACDIPNNAFPHGKVYSPLSGRIYSLNNGYATVAVIDPLSNAIERTIETRGISNLLLSPDGRFLIGKGADRHSDSEHVLGSLMVIDALSGHIEHTVEIRDIYPSTYRFSSDGTKLYLTSAATGKDRQRTNLNKNVLQIYDTASLPEIKLLQEIETGPADCGRRPIALYEPDDADASRIFVPNPTAASVSVIHGQSDQLLATVPTGGGPASDFGFSFWNGLIHGA